MLDFHKNILILCLNGHRILGLNIHILNLLLVQLLHAKPILCIFFDVAN